MPKRSRIRQRHKRWSDSHRKDSLDHIDVKPIQSILYRFFRFEISAGPSYPVSDKSFPRFQSRKAL